MLWGKKTKIPVVYLADYPTGAFVTGTGVRNAALEFNTCIYKARDVPTETRRDDINFAKPLNCFEWQSVYVYDFDKGRFETNSVDVPRRGEPFMRVKIYLLVILVTLFIALALVTFSRLGKFFSEKIATNQQDVGGNHRFIVDVALFGQPVCEWRHRSRAPGFRPGIDVRVRIKILKPWRIPAQQRV